MNTSHIFHFLLIGENNWCDLIWPDGANVANMLQHEYLVFTSKNRRRYNQERVSQSLFEMGDPKEELHP